MDTTNAGTLNVNTRNESPAIIAPASSSSTVNIGTSITVGRDQYNNTYQTIYYSNTTQNTTAGPSSSSAITPSASFNDAPLGLFSAHFTGRQNELEQILKALKVVRGEAPTRFGLYAGPGVGKTQLTLALAEQSFNQECYKYIFWITATTIEKLRQGFSKLLHLVGHRDRSETEDIIRLTAARRWLEDCISCKWLLVIDNVVRETVDFLREHLPRKNNHGNILFTTRTKNVATALSHASGEQHEILELQIPDKADATRLLLGHFRDGEIDDGDKNKVQEIVKYIGCLPLAIAQAAAYMKETGSTLDALLTIYKGEHKIDMMTWENDLSVYQEKSVAATFTYQLDDLQRQFPDVGNLLRVLAYLDPESIPLDMLITGANVLSQSQSQLQKAPDIVTPVPQKKFTFVSKVKNKINQSYKGKGKGRADETSGTRMVSAEVSSLLALIQSPTALPNAIAQLQNRSLTRQQGTGQSSSLWIHDLTRLIVLDNTKKGGAEQVWFEIAAHLACSALVPIQNPGSPQNWQQCEILIPHIQCEMLIPHIQSLTIRQGISGGANGSLLLANHWIAEYLRSRGRFRDAEVVYKQVLSSREKQLGSEHVDTLATKHGLALVYDSQGRHSDAEELYKQVLPGFEKQFGPEHVHTLSAKQNLAFVYKSQARYSDAEVLYKQVFSSREKQLGSEHGTTLNTKHNLAVIYNSQGRYSDAEVLCKQILWSREKQLGPEHVDTLATKHGLALVYNSQGRHSDAEELYKQVLSGFEKQFGPEHVLTLTAKHNLAIIYNFQGRYAEAEALLLHVLAGSVKWLGLSHPYTQGTQRLLAKVYTNQGRLDDAEKMIQSVSSSPP